MISDCLPPEIELIILRECDFGDLVNLALTDWAHWTRFNDAAFWCYLLGTNSDTNILSLNVLRCFYQKWRNEEISGSWYVYGLSRSVECRIGARVTEDDVRALVQNFRRSNEDRNTHKFSPTQVEKTEHGHTFTLSLFGDDEIDCECSRESEKMEEYLATTPIFMDQLRPALAEPFGVDHFRSSSGQDLEYSECEFADVVTDIDNTEQMLTFFNNLVPREIEPSDLPDSWSFETSLIASGIIPDEIETLCHITTSEDYSYIITHVFVITSRKEAHYLSGQNSGDTQSLSNVRHTKIGDGFVGGCLRSPYFFLLRDDGQLFAYSEIPFDHTTESSSGDTWTNAGLHPVKLPQLLLGFQLLHYKCYRNANVFNDILYLGIDGCYHSYLNDRGLPAQFRPSFRDDAITINYLGLNTIKIREFRAFVDGLHMIIFLRM